MRLLELISILLALSTSGRSSTWFLSQVRMAALGSAGKSAMCDLIPGISRRQRTLCQKYPEVMEILSAGAKLGVEECQRQFAQDRWNCTTVPTSGFGNVMLKLGSREAAFVYAISSAGVVHSISRACAQGQLSSCGCGRANRGIGTDKNGESFVWGGCADNVLFASKFSRKFLDSRDRRSRDGKSKMNLHNNRVGRKIVKQSMKLECKCHGVSGSCTTRTCWNAVSPFHSIGEELRSKYRRATQVTVDPKGDLIPSISRSKLLFQMDSPVPNETPSSEIKLGKKHRRRKRKVKRSALVYFEPSPDYCVRNSGTGSMGTAGRRCNKNSTGADSCGSLCCGRGYNTQSLLQTYKCHCKFVWCCRVECDECQRRVEIHTCKDHTTQPKFLHEGKETHQEYLRRKQSDQPSDFDSIKTRLTHKKKTFVKKSPPPPFKAPLISK